MALKRRRYAAAAEEVRAMPVGLSPANIARFTAGVLAALWAMAALADEYVAIAAVGPSPALLVAIACDIFLIAGASLAFVNAAGWRAVLLIALACATADRIADAIGSGAALAQIASALVACAAIGAVTYIAGRKRGRA